MIYEIWSWGRCEWQRGKLNLHFSEEQAAQSFRLKGHCQSGLIGLLIVDWLIDWLFYWMIDWLIGWFFVVDFRGTSLGTPSSSTGLQLKGGIRHFLFSHISKLFFRSDISWNFEKFLIHPDGTPVRRYSRSLLFFFVIFLAMLLSLDWSGQQKRRWCWSYWWWYNNDDDDI